MFIVLELQSTGESTAHLFTTFATEAEAESHFHTVLAAAAVSSVRYHSALLMDNKGNVRRSETYSHEVQE